MKKLFRLELVAAAALFSAVTAFAADAEEGAKLPAKYQRIVDRYPFGAPPAGFDPMSETVNDKSSAAAAQAAEEIPLSQQQEALQKSVTATAIVFDRLTGTPWLGFTDTSNAKSPHSHYVQLGASEDGWKVLEINLDEKTAKLAKDGVEIDVKVGAAPEKATVADAKRETPKSGASGRSPLLAGGATVKEGGGTSMASLRRQRQEREAAQQKQLEEERKARQAEMEENRRKQEEETARREQERAEREAERAAEREEYNQRVKNLAAALEEQMEANRNRRAEEEAQADE